MELTPNDQLEEIALLQSIAHIGSWHWNLQTNERSWSDEFTEFAASLQEMNRSMRRLP